jgi:hypothetical protein
VEFRADEEELTMKAMVVDIETMKELVNELQRSLCIIRNDRFVLPDIDRTDEQQWYALITKMLVLIYQLSTDVNLKAIINCAFDDRAIEETIKDLRAWNNFKKSNWVVYVANVVEQPNEDEILVVIKNIERN